MEINEFIMWLQKNGYKLMTDNPCHRPGEGYSPSKYIQHEFHLVYTEYTNSKQ